MGAGFTMPLVRVVPPVTPGPPLIRAGTRQSLYRLAHGRRCEKAAVQNHQLVNTALKISLVHQDWM